jgi:hypothetical protein
MSPSTITLTSVNSWNSFLENVRDSCAQLKCGKGFPQEAWFRRLKDSKAHNLLPSLLRKFKQPNQYPAWKEIWGVESDLFYEFAARARELHGVIESDWDILFAMQHYGTPTRLLDWTEVLGVAVYFATVGVDETKGVDKSGKEIPPPCVCILNPYRMNSVSTGIKNSDLWSPEMLGWNQREKTYYTYGELLLESGIDFDWPRAIYPRQRNPRLHAQRAWFTIHGDEFVPIEKMPNSKYFLRKIVLAFEAIPAARQFLEEAGIDHYLLFSDLESLSRNLREKHGFTTKAEAASEVRLRLESRQGIPKTA